MRKRLQILSLAAASLFATNAMAQRYVTNVFPNINTTFKLGASNLFNKKSLQVYGGPYVGRLAYFSLTYDLAKNK